MTNTDGVAPTAVNSIILTFSAKVWVMMKTRAPIAPATEEPITNQLLGGPLRYIIAGLFSHNPCPGAGDLA